MTAAGPVSLSHKYMVALSGEAYRLYQEVHGNDPGEPDVWAYHKAFHRAAIEGRIPSTPPATDLPGIKSVLGWAVDNRKLTKNPADAVKIKAPKKIVTRKKGQPNHAWRHRFKTKSRDLGFDPRVVDAIQGHAARASGDDYGDVSVIAMPRVIDSIPKVKVANASERMFSGLATHQ